MSAHDLVSQLLGEATVRLPPRGRRWIAVYAGSEPGQQIARSTRLTDKAAALAVAKRWEANSLRQRRARWRAGAALRKSTIQLPGLTQVEVALILKLSERAVRSIEKRAMKKLREHPAMRQLWAELESVHATRHQSPVGLSQEELAALFSLVVTSQERQVLAKLLVALGFAGH